MNKIKQISDELADNICNLTVINKETISIAIELKIKTSLGDILKEKLTIEEREYLKLIELQSTQRVGSKEYTATGYKLSALKTKKSTANRILNDLKKDDRYQLLKTFVIKCYGMEKFLEGINEL